MRADIAWAQMCHETGFLEFTGDVKPDQNNFVGIGATGGGVPGDSFATEELGIIAHYAHLAWYYYPDHINQYCSKQYDPRHFGDSHIRYTGDTTLGFLNGRWAPGATYTDKIILYANEIVQGIDQDDTTPQETVTAEAGDDKTAEAGQEISFDASGSTVSPITGDTVITYSWDWDGDGTYDESSEETIATYTFDEAGTYEVTLKVTAFDDVSDTDSLTVTVSAVNEIPIADPGGPYTALAGEEITFDGSGSSDSDGEIAQYIWDFGDDSTGSEVSPVHSYTEAGEYTLSLTVEDDDGALSAEVTTTVTEEEEEEEASQEETDDEQTDMEEESNQIPTADTGGPYTALAGEEITFDGSGSSDSDGDIAQYIWDFGDDSTGSEVSPVHSYTEAGEYTLSLTVEDDDGALSAEVISTVTVEEEAEEEEEEEEKEESYPVNTSPITNSTSFIGYTEVTVDQLVKIFEDRNSTKVDWARRIAPIYIKYGKLFNMRADIAWAMMCHETGFLEFTGDVKPDQNNFVGMGATGGGVPGNSFATEELGIIAHYAHLAWYYYPDHVNIYCSLTYDPRHFGNTHYRYTGDTTLGFLNGRWAPGSNYTDKIILFANKIYGF